MLVLAQAGVAAAWSLTHDDPTFLQLTRRCLERELGLAVEETTGDEIAASASGGTVRAHVEGGLVTISIVSDEPEAERLRGAYARSRPGTRLDVAGRYVFLWLRTPTPTQRTAPHRCVY